MTGMDAVEKQVEAFNARDLDAFVACYTREAVIEDADGGVQMSGRDEIRKSYGELFESRPNLRAEILSRIRVGSYVVDEEDSTAVLPSCGRCDASQVRRSRIGRDGSDGTRTRDLRRDRPLRRPPQLAPKAEEHVDLLGFLEITRAQHRR
jgi:hypothetical protein